MEFNTFIGLLQLALSGLQLKLDHFSKNSSKNLRNEIDEVGTTIRLLKFAISATMPFLGSDSKRIANNELSEIWANVSKKLVNMKDCSELASISFEKSLYWQNPEYYNENARLNRISLKNVLLHLNKLEKKQAKLMVANK